MEITSYVEFNEITKHIVNSFLGKELELIDFSEVNNKHFTELYKYDDIVYLFTYDNVDNDSTKFTLSLLQVKDMSIEEMIIISPSYIYDGYLEDIKDKEALYEDFYSFFSEEFTLDFISKFYESVILPLRAVEETVSVVKYYIGDSYLQYLLEYKLINMINKPLI